MAEVHPQKVKENLCPFIFTSFFHRYRNLWSELPNIFIFFFCRYKNCICNPWIELFMCIFLVFISFHKSLIEYIYKLAWILFLIVLFFFLACVIFFNAVTALKISKIDVSFAIDIFAYCLKIEYAKHCLHFHCLHL